ncbi:hypothetical protein N0V90_009502 [Kalmusia sp. IMI 367209]|nr:hypothetical protein N0V90_009502 [Kalmusia sp. IMI 367209]
MRVSTLSAILGLAASFASAAPVQTKDVQNREASPQWYDISYIDKVKREEAEKKRGPEAQWYDISYIDKVKREEAEKKREPVAQWYAWGCRKKRKADPQWYDISYIDKRAQENEQ